MPDAVVLRVAAPTDIESVVELYVNFRDSLQKTSPSPEQFRQALSRMLGSPDVRIHVAFVNGKAVGYATQRAFDSAWVSGREALLEDLYVKSECRGQGIGGRLVQVAVAEAVRLGCRSMSLDTNENNAASNAVYRRLGFTCARPRWNGGRQIRYDRALSVSPADQATAATSQ